jgi:hypothetical protein
MTAEAKEAFLSACQRASFSAGISCGSEKSGFSTYGVTCVSHGHQVCLSGPFFTLEEAIVSQEIHLPHFPGATVHSDDYETVWSGQNCHDQKLFAKAMVSRELLAISLNLSGNGAL